MVLLKPSVARAFLLGPYLVALAYVLVGRTVPRAVAAVEDGAGLTVLLDELAFAPVGALALSFIAYIIIWAVGAPAYGVLKLAGRANVLVVMAITTAAGAAFYLLPELSQRNPSFQFYAGGCHVFVDGLRTECGWERFWSSLRWNAAFGALAGLVF